MTAGLQWLFLLADITIQSIWCTFVIEVTESRRSLSVINLGHGRFIPVKFTCKLVT